MTEQEVIALATAIAEAVKEKLDLVEAEVDSLKARAEALNRRLDALEERLQSETELRSIVAGGPFA